MALALLTEKRGNVADIFNKIRILQISIKKLTPAATVARSTPDRKV
jgi:hypothetical protein